MASRSLRFFALAGTIAVLPSPAAIAASPTAPTLTADACQDLAAAATADDLRDRLDDLGIEPDERRISALLTELQWMGGLAFLSVTLNGDRVDRVTCQSDPAADLAASADEAHVLCDRIEMGMDLAEVRQALGAPGQQIIGEDGLPAGLAWQWEDGPTGQVAIVAFNNFGEMSGRSCLSPPVVDAPEGDAEADATEIESIGVGTPVGDRESDNRDSGDR